MKVYDVVAITGTYKNAKGEEKKRYQNVGAVLDKGNGPFLILEKWFNPAGLESQVLSLFAPKDKAEPERDERRDTFSDDIPF
jgi:hypothetical protein